MSVAIGPLVKRDGQFVDMSREDLIAEERNDEEADIERYLSNNPEVQREDEAVQRLRTRSLHSSAARHRDDLLEAHDNLMDKHKRLVMKLIEPDLRKIENDVDVVFSVCFSPLHSGFGLIREFHRDTAIPERLVQFMSRDEQNARRRHHILMYSFRTMDDVIALWPTILRRHSLKLYTTSKTKYLPTGHINDNDGDVVFEKFLTEWDVNAFCKDNRPLRQEIQEAIRNFFIDRVLRDGE
jgi:hypothetical protein